MNVPFTFCNKQPKHHNFGTKSYVLRSLWNLLLPNSNSSLFSPGHTLSPRFLSLGNTCRVPVTRPPETTSRSNSPVYPQRGAFPHAGDYSTLTEHWGAGCARECIKLLCADEQIWDWTQRKCSPCSELRDARLCSKHDWLAMHLETRSVTGNWSLIQFPECEG